VADPTDYTQLPTGLWIKDSDGTGPYVRTAVGTFDLLGTGAGGGGGGGGGAVTIADGADAALGATTDAAASSDTGTFSLIALVKRENVQLTALNTGGRPLKQIIDESTAGTTYIAEAALGTATSTAAWRVQRIVVASSVTTITWAGTGGFDQVATSLSTLTYN